MLRGTGTRNRPIPALTFWLWLLVMCGLKAKGLQTEQAPAGWILAGNNPTSYRTGVDRTDMRGGLPSAYLASLGAWRYPLGAIPADQRTVPATRAKAVSSFLEATSYRHSVNQRPTSPVRKSARWDLWEPEVGNCLRRPGGIRRLVSIPRPTTDA
jgi:hypothetical protein